MVEATKGTADEIGRGQHQEALAEEVADVQLQRVATWGMPESDIAAACTSASAASVTASAFAEPYVVALESSCAEEAFGVASSAGSAANEEK